MSTTELAPALFLAVIVILLACRAVGWIVGRLGQPPVVGEMIAGVVLGPSVLGLLMPSVQQAVFPDELRPTLYVLGQIGLVMFMFQAGYEFKVDRLRDLARTAGAVSAAGIIAPLALGVGVTLLAPRGAGILVPDVPVWVSAGFVGVALAITAFPMLARIITERGLTGSRHGSLALASGALDDGIAWILLAVVLSLALGSVVPVAVAAGGSLLFVVLVAGPARRFLGWSLNHPRLSTENLLLLTVIVLFTAAWYTDTIGLYAVFGAFAVGVAFPRTATAERVVETISPLSRLVFLPLFFTYSGLNTEFGLLAQPALLLFAGVCVAVAVIGKFGACWAAARLAGEPPAIAARVGTLMNARGLMQLIALNIGLEAGIVSRGMFTVLVLVALVTTVMATPCLNWLDRKYGSAPGESGEPAQQRAVLTSLDR